MDRQTDWKDMTDKWIELMVRLDIQLDRTNGEIGQTDGLMEKRHVDSPFCPSVVSSPAPPTSEHVSVTTAPPASASAAVC